LQSLEHRLELQQIRTDEARNLAAHQRSLDSTRTTIDSGIFLYILFFKIKARFATVCATACFPRLEVTSAASCLDDPSDLQASTMGEPASKTAAATTLRNLSDVSVGRLNGF